MTNSPLLDIQGLSLAFGGLKALDGFSLTMQAGDVQGLIGPNGAGKTTAFNLLTGVYRPDAGTIRLHGRRLNGLRPHRIARAGITRTFQNIRLFSDLSVLDNVRVACHLRCSHGVIAALLRTARQRGEERAITERPPAPGPVPPRPPPGRIGPQPGLWRPAPPGDRPCPGHQPNRAFAR